MPTISPIGTEFLVNTSTADNQVQPQITRLANGGFVVVWIDSTLAGSINTTNWASADVKARIYNADGTPAGGEFVVNNVTTGVQIFPNVISLTDGNVLFAWQDGVSPLFGDTTAAPATMMAREFTSAGVAVGNQFSIGGTASGALFSQITPIAGGGFVAVWQAGISGNIVGQVFNASNTAVGGVFSIDSTPPAVGGATVATLANGNIVVGWTNAGGGSLGALRVFTSSGVAVSGEIQINPSLPFSGDIGKVIALASGGFAVPLLINAGSNTELHVQLYYPDGTFGVDQTLAVVTGNAFASIPILAPLPNGGLAATWSQAYFFNGAPDIQLRLLTPIGDLIGSQTVANSITLGGQLFPDITSLANGDIAITWVDDTGFGGDMSGQSIEVRRFHVDYTNSAPVAVDDAFTLPADLNQAISTDDLIGNDTDPDGDPLTVTAITNVVGGTISLDVANQTFTVTTTPGYIGTVSFDYTLSDGTLSDSGRAVARTSIDDLVNVRGASAAVINFLTNDGLQPRANGYTISLLGGANPNYFISGTGLSSVLIFNPAGVFPQYLTLPVGQTLPFFLNYSVANPVTGITDYVGTIQLTLQGWTQTGGTGADNLVGGNEADHLIGGDGAANILTGNGGNDYYTITAVGDQVIEQANGGTDRVLSGLATYVLPANVEELQPWNLSSFNGTGNDLANLIIGSSGNDQLSGLAGNDRISGGSGADILNGGSGNDNLNGGTELDTASYAGNTGAAYIELGAGFALETALTTGTVGPATAVVSQDVLRLIENAIGSGFGDRIYGTDGDNVIAGGAGNDILYANGGTDTVDYSANAGAVFLDIAASTGVESALTTGTISASTVPTGIDYLFAFENANGSAFGDRLYGTSGINVINGGGGDDIIYGLQGNDTLNGGDGNDSLIGGEGVDIMTGGAGADRFFFSTPPEPSAGPPFGVDQITDFTTGVDQIYLLRSAFGLSAASTLNFAVGGPTAAVATFYNNSGSLYFDPDGTGAGAAQWVVGINGTFGAGDLVLYG
jgi:Ca2+-binding RTX toxin-like protein